MFLFLIFVSLFVAIAMLTAWMIDWSVHISMNKYENKPYDWCTFKTFKKEFDKHKNNPKLKIEKFGDYSIFIYGSCLNSILYLHANIIRFDDKCMILYPCSWLRYRIWKRSFAKSRLLKKEPHRQKGLFVK